MTTPKPAQKEEKSRKPRKDARSAALLDPDAPDVAMSIGQLAKEFKTTTRAIRFYELKGLLSPPRKGVARFYMRRERGRLLLIQRGQNLGFSLEEIRDWLALYDSDTNQVAQSRHLVERLDLAIDDLSKKRADIDRSIKELRQLRAQALDWLAKHKADPA